MECKPKKIIKNEHHSFLEEIFKTKKLVYCGTFWAFVDKKQENRGITKQTSCSGV